jgi:hypothetical protein
MKIIFICSLKDKAYGGIDVIVNFCECLNSLNYESSILNLKNINFFHKLNFRQTPKRYQNRNLKYISTFKDIKKDDFVIIPEILIGKCLNYFLENKIKFAVFFQSYTLIKSENFEDYSKAEVFISTSDYITKSLKTFFSHKNIIPLRLQVKYLRECQNKEKLISYMPRKLSKHSKLIVAILQRHIPANWKIQRIENLSHHETLMELSKSSIFLSITDFEGFGLPALEAGIHGNLVIGYSGVGGKEYFKKPIFHEIEFGDVSLLVKKVKIIIKNIENNLISRSDFNLQSSKLRKYYSKENQSRSLIRLAKELQNYV